MDVEFAYTRADWVEVDARYYRNWLLGLRPRREPVRGLIHEIIFRHNWQEQMLAKVKRRRAGHFRRLDAKEELVLTHRYRLLMDAAGLVLTTEYPVTTGSATRQEDRVGWDGVHSIDLDDHLLSFTLTDGRSICVPRTAFTDAQACERFLDAARTYRTTPPPGDTRIQTAGGVHPQTTAGRIPGV